MFMVWLSWDERDRLLSQKLVPCSRLSQKLIVAVNWFISYNPRGYWHDVMTFRKGWVIFKPCCQFRYLTCLLICVLRQNPYAAHSTQRVPHKILPVMCRCCKLRSFLQPTCLLHYRRHLAPVLYRLRYWSFALSKSQWSYPTTGQTKHDQNVALWRHRHWRNVCILLVSTLKKAS